MSNKSFKSLSIKSGINKVSNFIGQSASINTLGKVSVQYLVIAGGGGGGYDNAGGGGAGGYRCNVTGESSGGGASAEPALYLTTGVTYTVSVGAGGAGVNDTVFDNTDGTDSYIAGSGITSIVSVRGGKGARYFWNAVRGGSGGGMHRNNSAGYGNKASGLTGQGYSGSNGSGGAIGGGGGGAGGDASNATATVGGAGGIGVASSITGTSVYRGGGGGGGCEAGSAGGAGGLGGGGNGMLRGGTQSGINATANTGGGGGGREYIPSSTVLGNGGSGVVIIRATQAAASTTGSPTATTSGSYYIYTFNGSGSITY